MYSQGLNLGLKVSKGEYIAYFNNDIAIEKKYFHKLTKDEIEKFQNEIFAYAGKKNPNFLKILRERRKMDEEIEKNLNEIIGAYVTETEANREKPKEQGESEITANLGRDVLDEATTKKT